MKSSHKIIVAVLILLVMAFGLGLATRHKAQPTAINPANTDSQASAAKSVKSLVSYTLPDGWKENICTGVVNKIYINPAGTSLNCNADPSAPIKIYIDAQGTNDCQQLEHVQNVRKHICSSLFINNHKSLKSLTEYPSSGSAADSTVADYYIDSGNGVVAVEYIYTRSNTYQAGFDRFATSMKVN